MPPEHAISLWAWVGFVAFVVAFLACDLGLFHRRSREVPFREAAGWMAVWLAAAVLFSLGLSHRLGREAGTEFATGCLIEFSLSLDNVLVIALLFSYFGTPRLEQHRVLFWGILGALAMRGVLIGLGAVLIQRFDWMLHLLGFFLVLTGARMLLSRAGKSDPQKSLALRLARRVYPVSPDYAGRAFFTTVGGRRALTPLALVLFSIETSDLVFALDSIPATFAVTTRPFIVFTSNVFAVLMLRSLYFLLAGAIQYFRHLKSGLAVILVFIGAKMFLRIPLRGAPAWLHFDISTSTSLWVVGGILAISVIASVASPEVRSETNGSNRR